MKKINVAEDFSRYPAGRYEDDGTYSGEVFRKNLLIPSLESREKILILLDGTRGYGSSFLEEAFGGLVREGYDKKLILELLDFESTDKSLIMEIKDYIEHGDEE